jgi:hypothetical protein
VEADKKLKRLGVADSKYTRPFSGPFYDYVTAETLCSGSVICDVTPEVMFINSLIWKKLTHGFINTVGF